MVRYPVDPQQLIDLITVEKPNWIGRARVRTQAYAQARDYTGGSEFWGEIKDVYIRLQHEKCAYCETKLQGASYASKVHEVEHFRPKQSVKTWPGTSLTYLANFQPPCAMGTGSTQGYYQLAYHPFNYAIACTRCNSTLKSNYFPVRGPRDLAADDPSQMAGERALLVYPVSDIDEDPQELITFDGVLAIPKHKTGAAFERAVTTISFFQLNHEDLTSRRAEMLGQLWLNLEFLASSPALGLQRRLNALIDVTCSPQGQFSSCMKAFRALYASDLSKAKLKGEKALEGQTI
jgi:hypothetical protein